MKMFSKFFLSLAPYSYKKKKLSDQLDKDAQVLANAFSPSIDKKVLSFQDIYNLVKEDKFSQKRRLFLLVWTEKEKNPTATIGKWWELFTTIDQASQANFILLLYESPFTCDWLNQKGYLNNAIPDLQANASAEDKALHALFQNNSRLAKKTLKNADALTLSPAAWAKLAAWHPDVAKKFVKKHSGFLSKFKRWLGAKWCKRLGLAPPVSNDLLKAISGDKKLHKPVVDLTDNLKKEVNNESQSSSVNVDDLLTQYQGTIQDVRKHENGIDAIITEQSVSSDNPHVEEARGEEGKSLDSVENLSCGEPYQVPVQKQAAQIDKDSVTPHGDSPQKVTDEKQYCSNPVILERNDLKGEGNSVSVIEATSQNDSLDESNIINGLSAQIDTASLERGQSYQEITPHSELSDSLLKRVISTPDSDDSLLKLEIVTPRESQEEDTLQNISIHTPSTYDSLMDLTVQTPSSYDQLLQSLEKEDENAENDKFGSTPYILQSFKTPTKKRPTSGASFISDIRIASNGVTKFPITSYPALAITLSPPVSPIKSNSTSNTSGVEGLDLLNFST